MKRLENILVWMVKQMELAMPMNDGIYTQAEVDDIIGDETIPPEYLSAKESPSQGH